MASLRVAHGYSAALDRAVGEPGPESRGRCGGKRSDRAAFAAARRT